MAGTALPRVLVLLLALAGLAASARYALAEGWVPAEPLAGTLAGLLPVLAIGAGLAAALLLALRALGRATRARGGAASAVRPLEGVAAVAVVVLVALVATSSAGTAVLSLGLVGFGLTLALQRPILAVAGWGAIRFGRLFREGDRIEVRGIVGDVLDVGLFATRLWEIGSEASPLPWGGAVSPLRATGRIVTLSNATFLEEPVANATSDVRWVFDEFSVTVAYEADWKLAERLLREVATSAIDARAHADAAEQYARLVRDLPAAGEFPREPVVLLSFQTSWIELRLRYLVDVHRRSAVRAALARSWQEAVGAHPERLPNVYNRVQPMAVGKDGKPKD